MTCRQIKLGRYFSLKHLCPVAFRSPRPVPLIFQLSAIDGRWIMGIKCLEWSNIPWIDWPDTILRYWLPLGPALVPKGMQVYP